MSMVEILQAGRINRRVVVLLGSVEDLCDNKLGDGFPEQLVCLQRKIHPACGGATNRGFNSTVTFPVKSRMLQPFDLPHVVYFLIRAS